MKLADTGTRAAGGHSYCCPVPSSSATETERRETTSGKRKEVVIVGERERKIKGGIEAVKWGSQAELSGL